MQVYANDVSGGFMSALKAAQLTRWGHAWPECFVSRRQLRHWFNDTQLAVDRGLENSRQPALIWKVLLQQLSASASGVPHWLLWWNQIKITIKLYCHCANDNIQMSAICNDFIQMKIEFKWLESISFILKKGRIDHLHRIILFIIILLFLLIFKFS